MRRLAVLTILLALSARAEQKNVRVLTGLTDFQLRQQMNVIRASLGVSCDFCHVHAQPALDDKPEKRRAREMIAMVMRINRENFAGKPVVSCNTCHRGAVQPVSVISLPQSVPPPPAPPAPAPAVAAADLVQRYAAAIGDASRLALPRILRGTQEGWTGKAIQFVAERSGQRTHVVAETPNGHVEQWVTPDGGTMKIGDALRPISADDLETARAVAAALEVVPPGAIPADLRVTGKERIGDRDVFVAAAPGQRFYFDAATGLLVRRLTLTPTPVGELPQQVDYDDWRDAGGTMFPRTIRASFADPWASVTRRYDEVTLGAKIDEAVFISR